MRCLVSHTAGVFSSSARATPSATVRRSCSSRRTSRSCSSMSYAHTQNTPPHTHTHTQGVLSRVRVPGAADGTSSQRQPSEDKPRCKCRSCGPDCWQCRGTRGRREEILLWFRVYPKPSKLNLQLEVACRGLVYRGLHIGQVVGLRWSLCTVSRGARCNISCHEQRARTR